MSATRSRATGRAPQAAPEALNAPLFRLLMEQLDGAGRRVILDLGAASTPMLSLLGRFRCRVEIAAFAVNDGVARLNAEAPEDVRIERAEALLPARRHDDDALDLMFCWDLPNYLEPAALSALMRAIAARARPGALAHALIVYSERSMPARPGRFVPDDELKLRNHGEYAPEIAAPRYSPDDLRRIMHGFAIDRAMLLGNGMQEFLFRLVH